MKTTIASLLLLLVNLFFVFSKKLKSETNVRETTDEELQEAIFSRMKKKQCPTDFACFL